jgi:hypothetical protein
MAQKDEHGIYHCAADESHIWMADIGFCPYCNLTQTGRMHGMQQGQRIEKLEMELRRLKERGKG